MLTGEKGKNRSNSLTLSHSLNNPSTCSDLRQQDRCHTHHISLVIVVFKKKVVGSAR